MKNKIFYLLLISLLILGGCTNEENPPDTSELNNNPPAAIVSGDDQAIVERSESISDLIVDLYGIEDATTIILNDTAIIGIKIAYDQKMTDEVKNTIVEKVKEKDSEINQVKLTDKSNLFSQIDNIISELLQGKSYDSMVNEINKVQNKIK